MPRDKRVKGCPNENCRLHIRKKKQKANVDYCPECGERLIYVCKVCFREIQNSGPEHNICRLCEVERMERKEKAVEKAKDIAGNGMKAAVGIGATVVMELVNKEKGDLTKTVVKHGDVFIKQGLQKVSEVIFKK